MLERQKLNKEQETAEREENQRLFSALAGPKMHDDEDSELCKKDLCNCVRAGEWRESKYD